jgi:signal transduction histidine kinase
MSLLSMYATGDGASARELARAQAPTTDPVLRFLEAAGKLENYEAAREQQARARWERQQQFYRNLGLAGLAANALLALGASLAAFTALRRHRQAMAQLARRRDQLEVEATARATELNDVYGHLQMLQEQERSRIARGLHDELGGLLLAARMDATWLRQHPGEADGRSRAARIDRIIEVLDRGIDLKRRVIEELRPTLLDNMGLTAAIRWQVDEICQRAKLSYACHFPSEEPEVQPRAAIVLFRVAQEALNNIVKHAGATRVDVSIDVAGDDLLLVVGDDGRGIKPEQAALGWQAHGLAGMRHRLFALGGTLEVAPAKDGGTEVRARVPRAAGLGPQRGVPASPAAGGSASSPSASESSHARTWRSASSADRP